ncbi:MAG TPA: outer membrane beta-barrel protein [Flavitalea sp.]|nr:outer membrane beta-barrel protein [Flavitalea sp.]
MKGTIITVCSLIFAIHAWGQDDPDQLPFDINSQQYSPARLFGKVVAGKSKKGVEAASIQVFVKTKDSLDQLKDSLIAGTLTRPNGDFSFYNLPLPDSFSVKITGIGLGDEVRTLGFRGGQQKSGRYELDMGNIVIGESADMLGAVTVVAQRPALQLGIDRKIFSVDKSLTSAGGTAIDVMRNIPTVTVDIEGNVQLRGTSPQIFVDGRPTILTLEQIPADDIERVELITNPSAKFDAASTGGIINVILKKNRKMGLNGIASAGIGSPDILTGSLSVNLRQGKFNFFGSGNYNQSGGVATSESFRQNIDNGVRQDYFYQMSETERMRRFNSVRFGADYFIDNRNTISISQNFVNGRFNNIETQAQEFRTKEGELQRTGERFSDAPAQFNRSNSQLNYKHNFPKSGQELTADITFNTGTRTGNSLIRNYFDYYNTSGSAEQPDSTIVRNYGENDNSQLTIQLDYVNPITENSKIEMGLRSYLNDQTTRFDVFSLEGTVETKLPLSNNYRFEEAIHAGYITYTGKAGGIGYQAGLRGEYSTFTGTLLDSAKSFGYTLPADIGSIWDGLFPSLYLSKQLTDETDLQLNFSRRIRRPNFWQLNPYIDINDPLNISQGNPAIRPEYVNSIEFNYNRRYSTGSFLASVYFRNNQGDITRYSDTITTEQYEQLSNAGVDPNAILNTFINAQYTNRMGVELTMQQKVGKGLEFIPSVNLQYRKVKAMVGDLNLNNQGGNWEAKLITNYQLISKSAIFNNMNFQLIGEYESAEIIPQGRNREQYQVNFAIRKEFLKKNAGGVTFAINDLLNSNKFGQVYETDYFYQDSYRRWNVRNFRLTFTYRFGKSDFNTSKKEGRNRENREAGSDNE